MGCGESSSKYYVIVSVPGEAILSPSGGCFVDEKNHEASSEYHSLDFLFFPQTPVFCFLGIQIARMDFFDHPVSVRGPQVRRELAGI
jgi:hypothetical protein